MCSEVENIECWSYFFVVLLESVAVKGGDYDVGGTGGSYSGLVDMTDIYLLLKEL